MVMHALFGLLGRGSQLNMVVEALAHLLTAHRPNHLGEFGCFHFWLDQHIGS